MSLWQVFSSIIIRHPVLCSSYFMCVQIKKQNYINYIRFLAKEIEYIY